MDISETLVSNSTQLDNVDLMSGPRDFTITDVRVVGGEQPLIVTLAEYDRPWKPGVTMRRILAALWGAESDDYIGHRVRLFRDEKVTFGKDKTGGTRISHASHIEKAVTLTLPISKGKFGEFKVAPLTDAPAAPQQPTEPTAEQVAACDDRDTLRKMWQATTEGSERRAQIKARVAELTPDPPDTDASANSQWDDPTPDTLPTDGDES